MTKSTIAEVVSGNGNGGMAGGWDPVVGPEARAVLEKHDIPSESKKTTQREARRILARCVPPEADGRRTGLVIGYVQSGKTLSFTVLSAMARDNEFPLIITISGTSTDLFEQSIHRLQRDLEVTDRFGHWKHFRSDEFLPSTANQIQEALKSWNDDSLPRPRKHTVLLTVMKEGAHLDKLNRVLSRLDLEGVPAIVIDDEADRAGLNTMYSDGEKSPTYSRLNALRDSLEPPHSYLQYTATPQGPLLLYSLDTLAPDFAEVLTPGDSYTGGKEFFVEDNNLIRTIPEPETPEKKDTPSDVPDSLMEAMRVYFVGAAVTELVGPENEAKHRSMLVHPERYQKVHQQYRYWIENIKDRWTAELEESEESVEHQDCREEFRAAYDDLRETADVSRPAFELPSFQEVLQRLPRILRETVIVEMNARDQEGFGTETPKPQWHNNLYHIIVGGQKLNRGYTAEGLTVSYMARGTGVGNADTIQQRARWFGYKADYLGLCRVYLPDEVRRAYQNLVEHIERIHAEISRLSQNDVPLSEWKRRFILSPNLKPTRSSVLQYNLVQGSKSGWFNIKVPHSPRNYEALERNRALVRSFVSDLEWAEDDGHPDRTKSQRHDISERLDLQNVYEDLLLDLEVEHPADASRYNGVLIQIGDYLDENPEAQSVVYRMRPEADKERERSVKKTSEIKQLFQGANEPVYPGDKAIRDDGVDLTVQIHWMDRLLGPNRENVVARDVPIIAMYIPVEMYKGWLVEEQ